jgi:hypothetical protein
LCSAKVALGALAQLSNEKTVTSASPISTASFIAHPASTAGTVTRPHFSHVTLIEEAASSETLIVRFSPPRMLIVASMRSGNRFHRPFAQPVHFNQ